MILQDWFYSLNQTVDSGSFNFCDLDLSWLKTQKNEIFCLMNIASQLNTCPVIPNGKDLYVFSWLFEPFNDIWFLNIYNQNPQAEFIILSDFEPNSFEQLERVNFFQVNHHSTWINAMCYKNTRPINTNLSNRKYKLSSLSSRLNEFKFFITAKLYNKKNPQTLYTWNRGFEIRNDDDFVFTHKNYSHADSLLIHSEFLKNNKINSELFKNTPLDNSCFNHAAYLDTVINSINETQSLSSTPEFGKLPTPYITEKTWKPLFAGNAILFTGQAGLKTRLESWGFIFDYVWAQDYDDSFNDNQRLEVILTQINWILEIPLGDLARLSQSSVDHNLELAWSGNLTKNFKYQNENTIGLLQKHLGF
jgi:hypothetical protein